MRVALLVQRRQRRGAEVFAGQLAGSLERRGCSVCRVFLYPPPEGAEPPLLAPGDVELEGDATHVFERFPTIHPTLLRRLRRHLGELAPDVVMANGARSVKYGATARRLDRKEGWAFVYRNIGDPADWVRGVVKRLYYRLWVGPALDAVAAVSRATLEAVQQVYRPGGAAVVVPHAVDLAALRPQRSRSEVRRELATPQNAPVVVFVGRLAAEKRPDRLLRVFSRVLVELPDAALWIVGDGPRRGAVERRIATPPLTDAVRLTGERDDVADLLAAADLLLLTSDSEGVPGVVLEAGALGVPAVATDVGGVGECVEDGVTGRLLPAADESGLAAATIDVLTDPEARRRLGKAARRRVRERHDLERVVDTYLAIFRQAVDTRRRA